MSGFIQTWKMNLFFFKDEESTLDHPVQDILNLLPLVQFGC